MDHEWYFVAKDGSLNEFRGVERGIGKEMGQTLIRGKGGSWGGMGKKNFEGGGGIFSKRMKENNGRREWFRFP